MRKAALVRLYNIPRPEAPLPNFPIQNTSQSERSARFVFTDRTNFRTSQAAPNATVIARRVAENSTARTTDTTSPAPTSR
jgi:hypothetical protein